MNTQMWGINGNVTQGGVVEEWVLTLGNFVMITSEYLGCKK